MIMMPPGYFTIAWYHISVFAENSNLDYVWNLPLLIYYFCHIYNYPLKLYNKKSCPEAAFFITFS